MFYLRYPQIFSTVSRKLEGISKDLLIPALSTDKIAITDPTNSDDTKIISTASRKFETPPELLISRLSFSHIREIMVLDDPLERFFYELECIKGTWGVRELRRQIDTKLYTIKQRK